MGGEGNSSTANGRRYAVAALRSCVIVGAFVPSSHDWSDGTLTPIFFAACSGEKPAVVRAQVRTSGLIGMRSDGIVLTQRVPTGIPVRWQRMAAFIVARSRALGVYCALMDGWQFAASVIGSLAGPVAIVVLAVVFRAPLRRMVSGDVRRWKAGPSGLEVEFSEPLAATIAGAKEILGEATAELNRRITDLETAIDARGGNADVQDELRQLRNKVRAGNAALESLENTLDHIARLPPGVRGTVTWAAVAGRRPTVTFELVRPKPTGEDPKPGGNAQPPVR